MKEDKFNLYCDLLIEWNNKFNLTAITGREEIFSLHFCDSLLGLEFVVGKSVLDMGTGAGFPGIPLAIELPNVQFTLVDSLNKRVNFLNEVINQLELPNVRAVHSRAEDLNKVKLYDTVVSRAVAPLNVLAELCLPFVKKGGIMLSYKSKDIDEEIDKSRRAVKTLGGGDIRKENRTLNEEITRTFVIIDKVNDTPKIYPRGGNKPRTEPI